MYIGGNAVGAVGGANGGGSGGAPDGGDYATGGGGGGSSSVQLNGHVIVAAAGGGGGGGLVNDPYGGHGGAGGAAGQNGSDPTGFAAPGAGGPGHEGEGPFYGSAGTAAGPGAGGNAVGHPGCAGQGGLGCGGSFPGGGGGGGGYYGGGGGTFAGGGGGGYSYGYSTKHLVPVGTTPGVRITFTLVPVTITGFTPTSGPSAGGTLVTINGTNLGSAIAVKFGTVSGTGLNVVSPTQLQVISPEGTGSVALTVSTSDAQAATSPGNFTYSDAAPATMISGCNPTSGPPAGGTLVTLTGTGFTDVNAVKFGTAPAAFFNVISPTEIQASSPAGTGSVQITIPMGVQVVSCPTNFTYTGTSTGPTITGISPASGPAAGGTVVTLTGTNFTGATAVNFGANPGTSLLVLSPTQLQITSPSGTGNVSVSVTANGQASTNNPTFTYTTVDGPRITGTVSQATGRPRGLYRGWYNSPVQVIFTCTPGSAPLAGSCPAPVIFSKDGKGQSVTRTISDANSRSASTTVNGINIDQVAPTVGTTGATTGHTYLYRRTLKCIAHDSLSGVRSCTIKQHVTRGPKISRVTWTATATDIAGNTATTSGHYIVKPSNA